MRPIQALIDDKESRGGVDLRKLTPENTVYVTTRNSVYTIKPLENGKFSVQGGTRMPEPVELMIGGSTWGGSVIALKWIGIGMHIEMQHPNPEKQILLTSAVQSIKVTGPDWEYEIDK